MSEQESRKALLWIQVAMLLMLVFLFMSSVHMLGSAFKLMGSGFSDVLLKVTGNPFAGLMIGVMTTAVVQSSSATTSLVVSLVAAGTISIEHAVPVVMGANIGTTITCTLVSLGYVSRRGRFRRAFAAGTMHDIFNILTVAILMPLELATHYLSRAAGWLSAELADVTRFSSPKSPLKIATSMLAKWAEALLQKVLHLGDVATAVVLLVLAVALLIFALYYLTKLMRGFLAERMESILDRYIFRNAVTALLVGLLFTMAVQSSSVTTSLLVPLVAAGVVQLPQAFPYTMGANVGTTITALMAAIGLGDIRGLTIALVHTLFNVTGVAIFLPVKRIRNIPVRLAQFSASMTLRSRWYAVVYLGTVFFVLPSIFIFVWPAIKRWLGG